MNRAAVAAAALALAALVVVPPASAQLATMQNGVENIAMAPIDVAVAPYVAVRTVRTNLEMARMGWFGNSFATAVGVPWIWTLQNVLTGARIVSGIGEVLLGLALTPVSLVTDVPERQLFDATTYSPMVSQEGAFDVVIGPHYVISQ